MDEKFLKLILSVHQKRSAKESLISVHGISDWLVYSSSTSCRRLKTEQGWLPISNTYHNEVHVLGGISTNDGYSGGILQGTNWWNW